MEDTSQPTPKPLPPIRELASGDVATIPSDRVLPEGWAYCDGKDGRRYLPPTLFSGSKPQVWIEKL